MQKISFCFIKKLFFLYSRFLEGLLRQASNSLVVHCPSMQCFVSHNTENELTCKAEEFSDVAGQCISVLVIQMGIEMFKLQFLAHILYLF